MSIPRNKINIQSMMYGIIFVLTQSHNPGKEKRRGRGKMLEKGVLDRLIWGFG